MATHGYTKPLTEEEIAEVKAVFCRMPSYVAASNGSGESYFQAKDIPLFCEGIGWKRTQQQIDVYIDYWNRNFAGILPESQCLAVVLAMHDSKLLATERVLVYDKSGDGFISTDDFKDFIQKIVVHDPQVKHVDIDDFISKTDLNGDGRVSIHDCVEWIQSNISLP